MAFVEKLDGAPLEIVENVSKKNAAEAGAGCADKYHGRTYHKKLSMMLKAVRPTKIEKLSEAADAVERWEGEVICLEKEFKTQLGYPAGFSAGNPSWVP